MSFQATKQMFAEDAVKLWDNTKLLEGNRAERTTLLRERARLMESITNIANRANEAAWGGAGADRYLRKITN